MSGIITGPYFVSFFESPNAIEVGSIVAVLEIGAFSMSLCLYIITTFTRLFSSYVRSRRKDWRYRRSEMDLVWRCSCIHHWGTHSNFYGRRLDNDSGATRKRIWCWVAFVSDAGILVSYTDSCLLRTIVPIYQSEISPPNHVRHDISSSFS